MEHTTYPPTYGQTLRDLRDDAGVTQDEVAAMFSPPTTRQRLGRFEREGRKVSYLDANAYRAAVSAAVAAKVGTR